MNSSELAAVATLIGVCGYAGLKLLISSWSNWKDRRRAKKVVGY